MENKHHTHNFVSSFCNALCLTARDPASGILTCSFHHPLLHVEAAPLSKAETHLQSPFSGRLFRLSSALLHRQVPCKVDSWHPTDVSTEWHACRMLGGSTDWATEHHGRMSATGLNFSWGALARPSQVSDGFMPLGIRPASSPQNVWTFQGFLLYKALTSTRGNTLRTCAKDLLAFINLQWLNNHL